MKYGDHSDERLMELVCQGDRDAFGEVYDRYSDALLRYFYRMLWQDRELSEDKVQDLFVKIIRKPEQYDPGRPFRAWLYSVAANMCKNEYKRVEVRRNAADTIRASAPTSTPGEEVIDSMDSSAFNVVLEREVNALEDHHREAFILRYRQELSIREISQALECSEGTVKSRLFYAARKLEERLKAKG